MATIQTCDAPLDMFMTYDDVSGRIQSIRVVNNTGADQTVSLVNSGGKEFSRVFASGADETVALPGGGNALSVLDEMFGGSIR